MIAIRKARAHDAPFIIETWVDSYRLAHAAGMIAMEDWSQIMHAQVAKALQRPGVEAHVACFPGESPESRSDLCGWLAFERRPGERPLVHYVYVKQAYRRSGIARRLLIEAGLGDGEWDYACKTAVVTAVAPVIPHARWTPLAIRFPRRTSGQET